MMLMSMDGCIYERERNRVTSLKKGILRLDAQLMLPYASVRHASI